MSYPVIHNSRQPSQDTQASSHDGFDILSDFDFDHFESLAIQDDGFGAVNDRFLDAPTLSYPRHWSSPPPSPSVLSHDYDYDSEHDMDGEGDYDRPIRAGQWVRPLIMPPSLRDDIDDRYFDHEIRPYPGRWTPPMHYGGPNDDDDEDAENFKGDGPHHPIRPNHRAFSRSRRDWYNMTRGGDGAIGPQPGDPTDRYPMHSRPRAGSYGGYYPDEDDFADYSYDHPPLGPRGFPSNAPHRAGPAYEHGFPLPPGVQPWRRNGEHIQQDYSDDDPEADPAFDNPPPGVQPWRRSGPIMHHPPGMEREIREMEENVRVAEASMRHGRRATRPAFDDFPPVFQPQRRNASIFYSSAKMDREVREAEEFARRIDQESRLAGGRRRSRYAGSRRSDIPTKRPTREFVYDRLLSKAFTVDATDTRPRSYLQLPMEMPNLDILRDSEVWKHAKGVLWIYFLEALYDTLLFKVGIIASQV